MAAAEAERAALDAKINRLRLQKRMWFEKMARAISRGIDTVEELERVEREEAEALATSEASPGPSAAPTTPSRLPADFMSTWDAVYSDVPLEPALMTDFGFVGGPSFLAGQDSPDGTPPVSQGSGGS
ncbi:hypothetical protein N658DRAFT_501832 [Parathielavia hyrcaniae]|uniref:Uncharacterized protein n=1 Tax=Parathielavia hyrcaniae TaxID=113614 RepID=A0AAN6PR44_9PEZI|nr:hypothetical protein N658DRAFT_501832 [Parathielavia hyrcaniae]